MRKTATDLRAHLYELLDQVAQTGEPIEVLRKGVALSIVRAAPPAKRKKKPRVLRNAIIGDPDDLIHMEWPWSEGKDL